jgi:DNA-binding transcriptional MerR regulator
VQSGELSRLAGISSDTLRHYERLGVLPKPPRTNGGYRDYPANSLERVQLVQSALKVGFSLPELATILRMRDRGEVPCQRVRAIAGHKLEEVKQQIDDLLVMRDQLERILKDWDARLTRTGKGKPARLLESLPHDVIGSNASRLKAKHIRRGRR